MQYIVNIDIENLDKVDISSQELANLKNEMLDYMSTIYLLKDCLLMVTECFY